MPITPSKVTVKINNQNKTMTLINGEEINILKAAGLSDVSFELVLPQVSYPFSNGGAQSAAYYLSLFERLKVSKTPFQFILNRQKPGGGMFHYTNLTVGLETYEITDDAGEGFDVKVKINLKQYRAYGTKTVAVQPAKTSGGTATATVKAAPRPTTTAPKVATYTVKSGDCLWNIAKKQLGNGADYTKIYNLNKDKIKNPNLIYPGQVLTLPSGDTTLRPRKKTIVNFHSLLTIFAGSLCLIYINTINQLHQHRTVQFCYCFILTNCFQKLIGTLCFLFFRSDFSS